MVKYGIKQEIWIITLRKKKGNRNWSNIDREDEIMQQELENSSLKYDQSLKGKHEQNQEKIKKIF